MTTRRTHIVRISPDTPPSETYIDIEVLDAISFRGENGKEMVLEVPAKDCEPFIVDETGGNHGREPAEPTRRSRMERISGNSNKLDIETLEAIGFVDQNGEEWILSLPKSGADPSNTTEGTGGPTSTRRTHNEKVYVPYGKKGPDFITVERTDEMAFRTTNGQEVIIDCRSNDDPFSSDRRADTTVWSPQGYDPANNDGPKPPINSDPHNYVKFVRGFESEFITNTEKIAMGPLWWIRKINHAGGVVFFTFEYDVRQNNNLGRAVEPKMLIVDAPWFVSGVATQYDVTTDIMNPVASTFNPAMVIENPVSGRMLGSLNQWSQKPTWVKEGPVNANNGLTYFVTFGPSITAENATAPYPGTDQCGLPQTYGSAFGGSFFSCNPVAASEACSHGFCDAGILEAGTWGDPADAQYMADALNSLTFWQNNGWTETIVGIDLGDASNATRIQSRAAFALNWAMGKAEALKTNPNAVSFTVDFRIPASPNGKWILKGAAYEKQKDYPLDGENTPLWGGGKDSWFQDDDNDTFSGEILIRATVNFKDFTVEFDRVGEEGTIPGGG